MKAERDYFFDNIKAVLIFFVVLGHFLLPIHEEGILVLIKRLIYVFPRESIRMEDLILRRSCI